MGWLASSLRKTLRVRWDGIFVEYARVYYYGHKLCICTQIQADPMRS